MIAASRAYSAMFFTKKKRMFAGSIMCSLRLLGVLWLFTVVAAPMMLKAAPPGWWSERGVIDTSQAANDYAAVNQGQVKFIAEQAAAELDAHCPGGAGDIVHTLIATWGTPTATTNDFTAVNLGQLKKLAEPFYDRLKLVGYTNAYPWNPDQSLVNNYAAANIGQVKNLFSFDLTIITASNDTNHDGMADWWEQYYFHSPNVDPDGDPDGDGLSNIQEYLQGTDPTDAYNGQPPTIVAVSGTPQTAAPGGFAPQGLVVQVSNADGVPLNHATVTFSVSSGYLQSSSNSSPVSQLVLQTNSDGQTQAFYQLPNLPSATYTVTATATNVKTNQSVQATFTLSSDDGSATYASPFDLVTQSTFNADASSTLSWSHHLDGVLGFTVSRSNNNGDSWTQLASLPATSTDYNVAAIDQGVIGYSLFKVQPLIGAASTTSGTSGIDTPANPTINKNMPQPRYAVIDLGLIDDVGTPEQINNNGTVLLVTIDNRISRWRKGTLEQFGQIQFAECTPSVFYVTNEHDLWPAILDDLDNVALNPTDSVAKIWSADGSTVELAPVVPPGMPTPGISVFAGENGAFYGNLYWTKYDPRPYNSSHSTPFLDGARWSNANADPTEYGYLNFVLDTTNSTGYRADYKSLSVLGVRNGIEITAGYKNGANLGETLGGIDMVVDDSSFPAFLQNSSGDVLSYDHNTDSLVYAGLRGSKFVVLSQEPFTDYDVWGFNATKIAVTDEQGNSQQVDAPQLVGVDSGYGQTPFVYEENPLSKTYVEIAVNSAIFSIGDSTGGGIPAVARNAIIANSPATGGSNDWNITDVTAINDKGFITCVAIDKSGKKHANLLIPVQFSVTNVGPSPGFPVVDFIDNFASATNSVLQSPTFVATAKAPKQVSGSTIKLSIQQDIQSLRTVSFEDGSSTSCNETSYLEDTETDDPAVITTSDTDSTICTFTDAPQTRVSFQARPYVTNIRMSATPRVYATIQIGSDGPQVVAEAKWTTILSVSLSKAAQFSGSPHKPTHSPVFLSNPSPKVSKTIYGGAPDDPTPLDPRTRQSTSFITDPANWIPSSASGTLANRFPLP